MTNKAWTELMAEVRQRALAARIDDETIRKFHETFDGAERRKRENERRLACAWRSFAPPTGRLPEVACPIRRSSRTIGGSVVSGAYLSRSSPHQP
jgi:hypothetical protein